MICNVMMAVAVFGLAGAAGAAPIVANFDGGNGTGSPDAFVGQAGDGWAGPWTGAGTSSTVSTADPINVAGDPYLSSSISTSTEPRTLRRPWTAFMGADPTQPHVISWKWRFDGNFAQFASAGDRVHFFADSNPETGSNAGNAWLIGVTANRAGFGAVNGEFYFFDGAGGSSFAVANMFDTNLVLQPDTVYSFEVLVNPLAGTYNASVTDGVTSVSAQNLGFRNGTPGAYPYLHFGANASSGADNLDFALDSIRIAGVPEPTSVGLVLLGAALLSHRRSCR